MATLTIILKALRFIWPFIAEMFFAGKSLKQVLSENKLVSFLLALLFCSIFLNYLSFSKIYDLAVSPRREDDEAYVVKKNEPPNKPNPTEPEGANRSVRQGTDHKSQVENRLREIYGDN